MSSIAFRYLSAGGRLIEYGKAVDIQQRLVNARLRAIQNHTKNDPTIPALKHDLILFLQHPPTFTAGRRIRGDQLERENDRLSSLFKSLSKDDDKQRQQQQQQDFSLFKTDRGGELTYHGPGQLVAYPIMHLRGFDRDGNACINFGNDGGRWLSVRCFVDRLEQIMIDVLAERGVDACRLAGHPGVYVNNDQSSSTTNCSNSSIVDSIVDSLKIGSIGVHVSRFVTSHGLALNCERQTEPWFKQITVCGRQENRVTSLESCLIKRHKISAADCAVESTLPLMIEAFSKRFKRPLVPLSELDSQMDNWIDSQI